MLLRLQVHASAALPKLASYDRHGRSPARKSLMPHHGRTDTYGSKKLSFQQKTSAESPAATAAGTAHCRPERVGAEKATMLKDPAELRARAFENQMLRRHAHFGSP